MNYGPYYIWTTTRKVTAAQAKRINARVREIDDTVEFVGPLDIPGNNTTGWLERPNDGTNDYNHKCASNEQCKRIAMEVLGIEADHA